MKQKLMIIALMLGLSACMNPDEPEAVWASMPETLPNTPPGAKLPQNVYPITLNSNGLYVSSYGGGISFGSSFIHNTTVDPTGVTDGEPSVGWQDVWPNPANNGSASQVDASRFVMVLNSTTLPPDDEDIGDFFEDMMNYWEALEDDPAATPPNSAPGPPMITIAGQVVRDHNSPTNASVVDDGFVYTPSYFLASLVKGVHTISFYGPSRTVGGTVSALVARKTTTNQLVTVNQYSVNYTVSGVYFTFTGTVKIGTTTYTINDTVLDPI